jgi:hypothetical protein
MPQRFWERMGPTPGSLPEVSPAQRDFSELGNRTLLRVRPGGARSGVAAPLTTVLSEMAIFQQWCSRIKSGINISTPLDLFFDEITGFT